MFDPIVDFFVRVFNWMGRGIGWLMACLLWPFVAFGAWYKKRGWLIKGPVGLILLFIVASYVYLFTITQFWSGFDIDYAKKYAFAERTTRPGVAIAGEEGKCGPSSVIEVAADLTDFNVNRNSWVPSSLFYKLGFFGVGWKYGPFFDNKAAFQLGINEILRRTALEAIDRLGRVRGTSQIDQNLQNARENIYYREDFWYFSMDPFGPKSTTQAVYRQAIKNFTAFNARLQACDALFDPRADNLLRLMDQMSNTIGSTSDILNKRIQSSNAGWFDFRADDRFWFTYGQLYALNGIMAGVRSDFSEVIAERNLTRTWDEMTQQLRTALNMQPAIISNGAESAFIMPSHLATMGFYLLRVRANMTEMRDILDR